MRKKGLAYFACFIGGNVRWRDYKLVMLLCTSVSLKQALWPVISKRPLELDDEGSMATVF